MTCDIPDKRTKLILPSNIDSMRKEEETWHKQRSEGGRNTRQKVILAKPNECLRMPTKLGPILSARFKDLPLHRDERSETAM